MDRRTFKLRVIEPHRGFEHSTLLIAEIHGDGMVDLVTPAWSKSLGYAVEELAVLTFYDLLAEEVPAGATLQVLVAPDVQRIEFDLRCRNGARKAFRWYRQFDWYAQSIFIAGDEIEGRSGNVNRLRALG